VMPFAGILGRVGPLCPRVLFNREAVAKFDQEDLPMFFGNIGFRFDAPDNYRDVFVGGEIDAAVERFCDLLGWGKELRKLHAEAPVVSEEEGFNIFRRAQEVRPEFGHSRDSKDYNHCLQLMSAIDANNDGLVSREEFDSARAVLLGVGQDFLPAFEDFVVEGDKDAPMDAEAFVRSLRRLFEILGPAAFHSAVEQQLRVLVPRLADARSDAQRIIACFRAWDSDGTGTISRAQLGRLMRALDGKFTEAELDALMSAVDTNGSGAIEYTEFVEWVTSGGGSLNELVTAKPPPPAKAATKAGTASVAKSRAKARARSPRAGTSSGARVRTPSPAPQARSSRRAGPSQSPSRG